MQKFLKNAIAFSFLCTLPIAAAHADPMTAFRAIAVEENAEKPLNVAIKPVKADDMAAAAKGVFKKGDKLAFEIEGVKNAKLYILNLSSDGSLTMIYPNRFNKQTEPQKNDVAMIPAKSATYSFTVGGAPGKETVKIIAAQDTASLDPVFTQLFNEKSAFPRAVNPTEETATQLQNHLNKAEKGSVRTITLDYVIAK